MSGQLGALSLRVVLSIFVRMYGYAFSWDHEHLL
jgi:hypothetical protein